MTNTQLTILQKNGLFSFLGLVQAQQVKLETGIEEEFEVEPTSAVVKLDPREGKPFLKQFETNREAITNYEGAISTSIERGWEVVYRGQPLRG